MIRSQHCLNVVSVTRNIKTLPWHCLKVHINASAEQGWGLRIQFPHFFSVLQNYHQNCLPCYHFHISQVNGLNRVSSGDNGQMWIMMTSSNGNVLRVTDVLCGEFTGHRWIPHIGKWRGALMFSLICPWINGWVNNGEIGDMITTQVW